MHLQRGVDLTAADIRCGLYCAFRLRRRAGSGDPGCWDKAGQWNRWYRENIPVAEERYEQYVVERKNKERP
jgi:hypothetical protein